MNKASLSYDLIGNVVSNVPSFIRAREPYSLDVTTASRDQADDSDALAIETREDDMASNDITMKDYVDAQDEKSRAMSEAAFARLEAKFDSFSSDMRAQISSMNSDLDSKMVILETTVGSKLSELDSKVSTLKESVESLKSDVKGIPRLGQNVAVAVSTGISVLVLVGGIMALNVGYFGAGVSLGPTVSQQVREGVGAIKAEQAEIDAKQDATLGKILVAIERVAAEISPDNR